jgi:hypothetical protein
MARKTCSNFALGILNSEVMGKKMSGNLSLKTKLKHICIGSLFLFAPVLTPSIQAQTPGIVMKAVKFEHEDLMRPLHSMMNKIYNIKMSGDFDKDYAAIMSEFQQGGISLCKVYEIGGEDSKLLESARINAVELKEEERLLKGCEISAPKTVTKTKEPNPLMQILNEMMTFMEQKSHTGNIDNDYLFVMAAYGWANAEMAKAELHFGQNHALKNRSVEIIEGASCRDNTLAEWVSTSMAEK